MGRVLKLVDFPKLASFTFKGTNMTVKFIHPVIHVHDEGQTLDEIDKVTKYNIDGVFLIRHGGDLKTDLLTLALGVRAKYPRLFVGINHLGKAPWEALFHVGPLDMLWTDNAQVDERPGGKNEYARKLFNTKTTFLPNCYYFGGIAFKYQRPVEDLKAAGRIAHNFVDVLCTSGPGTGQAPDVRKIAALREECKVPIAIASGLTPANVTPFLPYTDHFMLATGIERYAGNIDESKLASFIDVVRTYST